MAELKNRPVAHCYACNADLSEVAIVLKRTVIYTFISVNEDDECIYFDMTDDGSDFDEVFPEDCVCPECYNKVKIADELAEFSVILDG